MGIHLFSTGSDYGTTRPARCSDTYGHHPSGKLSNGSDCVCGGKTKIVKIPGQPDPLKFDLRTTLRYGDQWTLAWVVYPDAQNYEGSKVLLLHHMALFDVRTLNKLDPHFQDQTVTGLPYRVFARFEPTEQGWHTARHMAKLLETSDPNQI